MSVVVKKRNFKPYVLNWLVNKLGLASGVGRIYYMAVSGSAIETQLLENGVPSSEIFTTLNAAHDACTTLRNDVVLVAPGAYAHTTACTWSKSMTHLVGMSGPVGDSDYYMDGPQLYTETITVASVMDMTGYGNQVWDVGFDNNGANAACLRAVRLAGYGCRFNGVTMKGIMNSTQAGEIAACSLLIASGASNYVFDNCTIGGNNWQARTTSYQGHVYYGGTTESGSGAGSGPMNGFFKNTMFYSQGTTAAVPMIRVGGSATQTPAGNEAMDRTHTFINCHFDNWYGASDNLARITSVFDDASLTYHHVRLLNCSSHGYEQWRAVRPSQNGAGNGFYSANMTGPGVAAHPGEGVEPTS